jgi:protocatechuate 3,4-dioxygenase beta subunit
VSRAEWKYADPLSGLAVPAALFATAIAFAVDARPNLPGTDAPSEIRIAAAEEPGTPLEVEGTVYAPDGETPAPGVVLYVYQTGLDGLYARDDSGVPRLRGYVKTDSSGRYSYRTIRPGSYPRTSIPAHVHTQLWGGGYEPQWNRDLNFGDDPFLPDREKADSAAAGLFAWVCDAKPDAGGTIHCTHNLRLKTQGDSFEPSTRHGLDAPAS